MSSATREDVISCYRVLLEREPESEAVISAHLKNSPSVFELIKRFLTGEEFARRFINQRAGSINFFYSAAHRIDLDVTEEQLQRLHDHVCQAWTRLGAKNPHWSVLTSPQYYPDRMTPEVENAFYETGALDVKAFMAVCERNGIAPNCAGTVVDLGCGIGRVGVYLSERFHKYVGVDVSTQHLSLARSRLDKTGRSNADFRLLPEFLSGSDTFDTFVSLLVLQHNPPPIISNLLKIMLARLNPGGIAFFQVPSILFKYNFNLTEYLQSIGDAAGMEMHAFPQQRIFEILALHDCQPVELIFDGKVGELGISYTFLARKR